MDFKKFKGSGQNAREVSSILPVGEHKFMFSNYDYDEEQNRLEITLLLKNGRKHIERFYGNAKDGGENTYGADLARKLLAYVLQKDNVELNEENLNSAIGCFVCAKIKHERFQGDEYAKIDFYHLTECDGF